MSESKGKKRCFVVMGFGKKTDYATGRELDLDKSYQLLIKPIVEQKGMICKRADEINHSGMIDVIMYQELLSADLVIADLSTANLNAIYELGIRHALKPYTTIVISEEKLTHPFNLNHISICNYKHLGDDIGFSEVERFRSVLLKKIEEVFSVQKNDSPVYTFLKDLVPPTLQDKTDKAIKVISNAVKQAGEVQSTLQEKQENEEVQQDVSSGSKITLRKLTQLGEEALKKKRFGKAKEHFEKAVGMSTTNSDKHKCTPDPYLVHSLALATYKARKPTILAALNDSLSLLEKLDLQHTNDPKTVALAGAIEKKLYERTNMVKHLSNSIQYFERGYFLLNNRYHAINLAYLLSFRAISTLNESRNERIADIVSANRVRKRVLELCEKDWNALEQSEKAVLSNGKQVNVEFVAKQNAADKEQRFWIMANKAEAYLGLRLLSNFESSKEEALSLNPEIWMVKSFTGQVEALEKLLNKQEKLLGGEVM